VTVVALFVGSTAVSAWGEGGVLAPSNPASYQELSAKWWQWAASTVSGDTGPFGSGEVRCGENQPTDKTWFLAGTFSASAARSCDIPAGTQLFLPIINVECSSLESAPFFGATVAARRACVEQDLFSIGPASLKAELDGHDIVSDHNYRPFTVESPNFPLVALDGNAAGIPPGRGFSVSRGVWLLLAPLSRGEHTLHFEGAFPNVPFAASATYELRVG